MATKQPSGGNDAPMPNRLGRRVKELREAQGITQRGLAELVGVTPTSLWRIEHGVHLPRQRMMERLAAALNAPSRDLLVAAGYATEEPLFAGLEPALVNAARGKPAAAQRAAAALLDAIDAEDDE